MTKQKSTRITPVVIRPGGTPQMVKLKDALSHFEYRPGNFNQRSNRDVFRQLVKTK